WARTHARDEALVEARDGWLLLGSIVALSQSGSRTRAHVPLPSSWRFAKRVLGNRLFPVRASCGLDGLTPLWRAYFLCFLDPAVAFRGQMFVHGRFASRLHPPADDDHLVYAPFSFVAGVLPQLLILAPVEGHGESPWLRKHSGIVDRGFVEQGVCIDERP